MRKLAAISGVEKGTVFALAEQSVSIGRAEESLIRLDDDDVSRQHAVLVLENGEYRVRDLGSRNGTFVNGQRVMEAKLVPGDSLRVGLVELVYEKERVKEKPASPVAPGPAAPARPRGERPLPQQPMEQPIATGTALLPVEKRTSRKAWMIFWIGIGSLDLIFVAWYAHHLMEKRNRIALPVPVVASKPVSPPPHKFADPKGLFVCVVPAGWQVESNATAGETRSKVSFVSGSDEIRVIAQDSTLPELTESDRAAAVAAFGEMLERARAGGASGKLVGTSWREATRVRTLVVEVEVESPRYSWMRQVKFRQDGVDHTVALYVGAPERRQQLELLFETFLATYHGAGKPSGP